MDKNYEEFKVEDTDYSAEDEDTEPENNEDDVDEESEDDVDDIDENDEDDIDEGDEETDNSEEVKHDYKKMYTDTKRAYTKSRQEIAALKAHIKALSDATSYKYQLEPKIKEELDRLKVTDPEAYRQSLNAIENAQAKEFNSKVLAKVEIARRKELLKEYNASNPKYKITEYVVKNVLPASFYNRLANSEITFETFLKEANRYLRTRKIGPGNSKKAGISNNKFKKIPTNNVANAKKSNYENSII